MGALVRLFITVGAVACAAVISATPASAFAPLQPGACIEDLPVDQGCAAGEDGLQSPHGVAVSPDGISVYTVTDSDDTIVRFNRDPLTGVLTYAGCIEDLPVNRGCAAGSEGLNGAFDVTVAPDGENVYVASSGSDNAVVVFNRNTTTGALQFATCIEDDENSTDANCPAAEQESLQGAKGVAVSPDNGNVYVAADLDGAVTTFQRLSNGSLSHMGCAEDLGQPTPCAVVGNGLLGVHAVEVSSDGGNVYTAADTDSAVQRFTRAANGTLTQGGCFEDPPVDTSCTGADGLEGASDLAITADGTRVFVAGVEDFAVASFLRQTSGGALTDLGCAGKPGEPHDCAQTIDGFLSPTGLAMGPSDDELYVSGGNVVFRLDRGLFAHGCVEAPPVDRSCDSTAAGLTSTRDVTAAPDGNEVYASSGLANAVATVHVGRGARCQPTTAGTVPGQAVGVPLPCSDADGDATTIEIASGPANGALGAVDQTAARVVYTPNAGFSGVDSFTYRAVSNGRASAPAEAVVLVASATGPPGPTGPPGAPGIGTPGVAGSDAPLIALLAQSRMTVKRGKTLPVLFAATRNASVEARVLKGRATIVRKTARLARPGRGTIRLRIPRRVRRRALEPGNYTVELQVTSGADRVTDRARLSIKR